ncbi:hypothetical protein TKK_0007291 [Trichogramma kaykai]
MILPFDAQKKGLRGGLGSRSSMHTRRWGMINYEGVTRERDVLAFRNFHAKAPLGNQQLQPPTLKVTKLVLFLVSKS